MITLKKLEMKLRNLCNNKKVVFLNCNGKSRMHVQVTEYIKCLPMIDPKRMQVSKISYAFQKNHFSVTECTKAMSDIENYQGKTSFIHR